MLQEAINEFSKSISKRKENYHYHLLQNETTCFKIYWLISKILQNHEKAPLIPNFNLTLPLSHDIKGKQTFLISSLREDVFH